MSVTLERPLRRDAERNRQRVLAAARELFAERGLDVTLDDIARGAGVGVGTVYRRFPDKEQLIDALFEERVGEIRNAASESLQIADPWTAFVSFLERALELQAEDRGLKEVLLSSAHGQARVEHAREEIEPLVAELLNRARAAGAIREDLDVHDLILLQHAIGEVADYTREADPQVWRRMLVIVLDGLRPDRRRPSRMPCSALDDAGLVCSMQNLGSRRRRGDQGPTS
jgi:AcrR family transcriptional regulator